MKNAEQNRAKRENFDSISENPLHIMLIMGLMGAFFWAIRGTGGYGGSQGAALAGLGWGLLWWHFSSIDGNGSLRPYGSVRMIAALTFGMAIGGMTGYGVYTAWVRGDFYLNHPEGVREVGAWTGYAMLFVCGLHWGGIAGAFMAWCAPGPPLGLRGWGMRIGAGIVGAVLAGLLVRTFPQFVLPFYREGLYGNPENATCRRALGSVQNIAPHVGLFLGFLAFELFRGDRRAVGMILVMSLGFAIPFSMGGWWHTFDSSPLRIDWWKNWEMSIGLGGGLAIGLAFLRFNRPDPPASPRSDSVKARIWGAGFPLGLASFLVFMGAYKGVSGHFGLDWPAWVRPAVSLAYVVPAGAAFLLWARAQTRAGGAMAPLPAWTVPGVLALIVVSGYAVSIPPKMALANGVLLFLYTVYLGASLLLYGLLSKQRRGA